MKKLLLTLTLALCFVTANAKGFGIGIGPKFGYQTKTLSLKKADIENSFKNSWTAGLFVRMNFGSFVLQPELLYFNSEQLIKADLTDYGNLSLTMKQQNLSLPIFVGYQLGDGLIRGRFTVGPVMNFVVGQKNESNILQDGIQIEANKMTWSAAVNAGIDIWRITLDVCYSFGLTDVFKTTNIAGLDLDTRQNIFIVTLGLRLLD